MNTSAIMDLINELESSFSVDRWEAGGIHIWPYLRIKLNFDLYYAYHTKRNSLNAVRLALINKLFKSLFRFCYAFITDAGKNRFTRSKADVVLVSDGLSYAFLDGVWYEKFCDPLIDMFTANGISTFQISLGHTYHIPRRSPSLFIQPRLDAARIRNKIFPHILRANNVMQEEYSAYRAFLENKSLRLAVPVLAEVEQYASTLRSMTNVFCDLLRKTSPSIVFVVSYYGLEGMSVNLACREMGIPSVDLQHGLQGDLHVAYARWNRVPVNGYALLPSIFWVWEERNARTIEKWNGNVQQWHRPLIGGNLWLNEWCSGKGEFIAEYDRSIEKIKSNFPGKPHILLTLQFNLVDEQTLGPLLTVMQRTQKEWRWWVRLHPCMLNETTNIRVMLKRHGITNIELDLATNLPLYALLRHMDIHVTHSSSTVIEAKFFGVPSIVISEYGAEFFSDEIDSGWAHKANSSSDIRDAVIRQLNRRHLLKQSQPPLPNLSKAFNEILSLVGKNGCAMH